MFEVKLLPNSFLGVASKATSDAQTEFLPTKNADDFTFPPAFNLSTF